MADTARGIASKICLYACVRVLASLAWFLVSTRNTQGFDLQRFCHMAYALVKSFGNFTVYNAIVFMGTPICTFLKKKQTGFAIKTIKGANKMHSRTVIMTS